MEICDSFLHRVKSCNCVENQKIVRNLMNLFIKNKKKSGLMKKKFLAVRNGSVKKKNKKQKQKQKQKRKKEEKEQQPSKEKEEVKEEEEEEEEEELEEKEIEEEDEEVVGVGDNEITPESSHLDTLIVRKKKITTTTTTTISTIKINSYSKVVDDAYKTLGIYLCTYTNPDLIFNWYKIDPQKRTHQGLKENGYLPTTSLESFLQMPISLPQIQFFYSVLLDSRLYAIGGAKLVSREWYPVSKTFVCDISSPHQPPLWKECSPMASAKESPIGVVANGKIYVFDSNSCVSELDTWGEVFHPDSALWEPLPSPPDHTMKVYSCAYAKQRGEIFVFPSNRYAYSFNLQNRLWKEIPVYISFTAKPLILGDILYTYDNGNLFAYDLTMSEPCPQLVYGLEEETSDMNGISRGQLFYIGKGKLCLLWHEGLADYERKVEVFCLRFWVGRRNGYLHAVIDRCESYLAYGNSVCNYVAT